MRQHCMGTVDGDQLRINNHWPVAISPSVVPTRYCCKPLNSNFFYLFSSFFKQGKGIPNVAAFSIPKGQENWLSEYCVLTLISLKCPEKSEALERGTCRVTSSLDSLNKAREYLPLLFSPSSSSGMQDSQRA